ncbi:UNC93-like protein 2 [Linum grandiflorum]
MDSDVQRSNDFFQITLASPILPHLCSLYLTLPFQFESLYPPDSLLNLISSDPTTPHSNGIPRRSRIRHHDANQLQESKVRFAVRTSSPHRISMFLLSGDVQRTLRHGRRRPGGPHRSQQRQHRPLHHIRRLRSPRRRLLQHPRPSSHPRRRLLHLRPLRRLLPLLQPPQTPGVRGRRRRHPRHRRRVRLGGARRHHDVVPSSQSERDVHLPLLEYIQHRRSHRRPHPFRPQLPPPSPFRQRRHLHRIHGLYGGGHSPLLRNPPAQQSNPRRRNPMHEDQILQSLHGRNRDLEAVRKLEDASHRSGCLGVEFLLHLPIQQRQRREIQRADTRTEQRVLLGSTDGGFFRDRVRSGFQLQEQEKQRVSRDCDCGYVGFYKGVQSAGAAISWQLDTRRVPMLTQLIVNWVLTTVSYPLLIVLVALAVSDEYDEGKSEGENGVTTSNYGDNSNSSNNKANLGKS